MDLLISRYRNLTALVLVVMAQLVLLGYQVKGDQDVRLIRVWSVTAVTPLARVLEFLRENTIGVAQNYFVLVNVRGENARLREQLGQLKLENQFLRNELDTAERARALQAFQEQTQSRTLAARIIGTGTGANSRVVFVDQGSGQGVKRGMAVITPDGIVGKVLASYPTASQVLLMTDPTFAAGVISQKNRVHGTVRGAGQSKVTIDHVQNEEKVEQGELFYTSGDDRIFPKGMPVGRVTVVREGRTFKEIFVEPAAFQQGIEEVLIVLEGVHGSIPDPEVTPASSEIYLMPPPPEKAPSDTPATTSAAGGQQNSASSPPPSRPGIPDVIQTDADRLRERYKRIGDAQGHTFGTGAGKVPNFNVNPDATRPAPQPPSPAGRPQAPAGSPAPPPDRTAPAQ